MSIATIAASVKVFAAARPVAAAAIAVGTGVVAAGSVYGGIRLVRYYKVRKAVSEYTSSIDKAVKAAAAMEGEIV